MVPPADSFIFGAQNSFELQVSGLDVSDADYGSLVICHRLANAEAFPCSY